MKRIYYIVACLLAFTLLPAQAQEENDNARTTQQQR